MPKYTMESKSHSATVSKHMECIIRDDAYLSSDTVTALQRRRGIGVVKT